MDPGASSGVSTSSSAALFDLMASEEGREQSQAPSSTTDPANSTLYVVDNGTLVLSDPGGQDSIISGFAPDILQQALAEVTGGLFGQVCLGEDVVTQGILGRDTATSTPGTWRDEEQDEWDTDRTDRYCTRP